VVAACREGRPDGARTGRRNFRNPAVDFHRGAPLRHGPVVPYVLLLVWIAKSAKECCFFFFFFFQFFVIFFFILFKFYLMHVAVWLSALLMGVNLKT
jgi:hypothetical protein